MKRSSTCLPRERLEKGTDAWCRVLLVAAVALVISSVALAGEAPVVELRMDEGSGTIAKDSSGRNNHGTVSGATWCMGYLGQALAFNGRDAYLEIPAGPVFDVEAYTVQVWVKMDELPTASNAGWLVLRCSGADYYQVTLRVQLNDPHPFGARVEDGGNDNAVDAWSKSKPELKNWTRLSATFEKGTLKLYVNGKLEGEAHMEGLTLPKLETPLRLGCGWGGYFKGELDEFRFYSRALSAKEITAGYQKDLAAERKAAAPKTQ